MVANPEIRKTSINARELEQELSKLQQESGYPYIVNVDTVNQANPVDGVISMSNLCSEILQVQTPSVLNDDQTYKVVGTDVACNLGSTNVLNMMTSSNEFGTSIEAMVRALTFISKLQTSILFQLFVKVMMKCMRLGLEQWAYILS